MKRRDAIKAALATAAFAQSKITAMPAKSRDDYPMKLGIGLGPGQVSNPEVLQFVRQLGVTHIVAHTGFTGGIIPGERYWEYEDLARFRKFINSYDMELGAIESFPATHTDKILLGEPGREQQIEDVKKTLRNMGKAGIPILGYHFSLAKVWGSWRSGNAGGGRGGAGVRSFDYELVKNSPLMTYEELMGTPPSKTGPPRIISPVSQAEMWSRLTYFLKSVIPTAEESHVRMGAHPDDPPVPVLRGTGRLITSHDAYQRLVDIVPSPSNGMEFCQGTVAEMGQDVYEAIRRFGKQKKICYVHFRNIKGHPPNQFDETFADDGDVDMVKAMRIYKEIGYDGIMIPDHSPTVTCPAPWHAGFAFALGYMKALMQAA